MIESERVAKFVNEDGLEIVGVRVEGQCGWCGEGHVRVARQQKRIRVQNFSDKGGRRSRGRELLPDRVRGNHAGECQNAERESWIVLIEADGIEAIGGRARSRVGRALQRTERGWREQGA